MQTVNALFFAKVIGSALVIGIATEVAKRHPFWGAVIIALPLTSILAMSWLYADTHDSLLVTKFARDIFMVLPVSLLFFLPFLIERRTGLDFLANMAAGLVLLALGVWLLRRVIS